MAEIQDSNITPLRPKAKRQTRAKPDRTNSERQKRFRDKRKAPQLPVTPKSTVTPPPTDKARDAHNAVTVAAPTVAPRNADTVTHGAVTAALAGPARPRIEVLPPRYRTWSAIGRAGVGLAI